MELTEIFFKINDISEEEGNNHRNWKEREMERNTQ
jgi:hypothetical protein